MKGFPALWHDPAPDELYRIVKVCPIARRWPRGLARKARSIPVSGLILTAKARVFGTTLGHSDTTMSSDTYLDLLTRGLLWACDKLDENGKPKEGFWQTSRVQRALRRSSASCLWRPDFVEGPLLKRRIGRRFPAPRTLAIKASRSAPLCENSRRPNSCESGRR